jgi:hemerythrin superfamily protein
MNPVKLLKQDHRTVKGLFRQLVGAGKRSERQKIGQQIIEELSVHAAIEEQLIYPALRARDQRMEKAALNALEEHHAMKLTLLELDKMDADDERYAAKMHVVQEAVNMHIEEEEGTLLPRLESLFDDEELKAMGDAVMAMKHVAPNHPHPAAPDTPPGNVLASMFAKLSDASKDVIRKLTDPAKAEGHRRVRRRAVAATQAAKRGRRAAA